MTFVAGEKELKEMDEKLETGSDDTHRKLQRHWANISFVILASLTVVLPGLFIVLGIMIWLMDNKSTASKWHPMEDAIKVSVSAWPIVFAAVVAQCFKAWATYRVERGIKLMELEQLIGSNSFSSAMKQPIMLRNLNFLTLGLIGVWCLSPLGSQALQRVYTIGPLAVEDSVFVTYLDKTRNNTMLGWGADDMKNPRGVAAQQDVQLAAVYYLSTFLPASTRDQTLPKQDRFDNPHVPDIDIPWNFTKTSKYGVPVSLPSPVIPGKWNQPSAAQSGGDDGGESDDDATPDPDYFENISFSMNTSYFKLKCDPWTTQPGSVLDEGDDDYTFSWSNTLAIAMSNPENDTNSPATQILFASRNHNPGKKPKTGSDGRPEFDGTAPYSVIRCNISQVFVQVPMKCERKQLQRYLVPDCDAQLKDMTQISAEDAKALGLGTNLSDISSEWVDSGSIYTEEDPITPGTFSFDSIPFRLVLFLSFSPTFLIQPLLVLLRSLFVVFCSTSTRRTPPSASTNRDIHYCS